MVGAHISVSVLETPRTLDSFFPPVDETQPRRWAKALLRRQAAPKPRAARQSSATGRLPDGTLLAGSPLPLPAPPPRPPQRRSQERPRAPGRRACYPHRGSEAPGPILVCTRILRRSDPCRPRSRIPRTSFPGKLGNFWAYGRIGEELGKNGVVAYRSPTFLGGE